MDRPWREDLPSRPSQLSEWQYHFLRWGRPTEEWDFKSWDVGTSLVVQWLRFHPLKQRVQV